MGARPYRTTETAKERLGAVVSTHVPSRLAPLRSLVFLVFLALFGLMVCTSTVEALGKDSAKGTVLGLLVGMGAWMGALGIALRSWTLRGLRVEVREHGLVRSTRAREVTMRWEDVAQVWVSLASVGRLQRCRCLLVAEDGHRLEVAAVQGVRSICARVQQESVLRHLPRALADLRAGREVAFGPFAVTSAGVAHATEHLPWKDVAGAALGAGRILVGDVTRGIRILPKRDGILAWGNEPYDAVPNAAVFLALVERLKGSASGGAASAR